MNAGVQEPPKPEPLVRALPGRLFFGESVPCPAGLPTAEILALAHLTVESRSPFPEDKLSVCFRHDRTAGRLLIFAALKERLVPYISDEKDAPTHVVPDAALPLPAGDDGWCRMLTEHSLTWVRREREAVVELRSFSPPVSPEDAPAHASRMAAQAGLPDTGPLWSLTDALPSRQPAGVTLHWRDLVSQTVATSFMTTSDLDAADVRPPETLLLLRRAGRAGRRMELAFRGLGVAAGLLLLAQCGVWVTRGVAAHRETTLEANRPSAETAEANAAILETLSRVTDRRAPLLERLAALNEPRPDAVWLRRVVLDDKSVLATGQAHSMESLNGWLAALRSAKDFSDVATPRITATGQSVSFELRAVPAKTTGKAVR